MKKLLLILIGCISLLLSSCTDSIEVTTPEYYSEYTIRYVPYYRPYYRHYLSFEPQLEQKLSFGLTFLPQLLQYLLTVSSVLICFLELGRIWMFSTLIGLYLNLISHFSNLWSDSLPFSTLPVSIDFVFCVNNLYEGVSAVL